MAFKVVYSSSSEEEVREILNFLLDNWGHDVADRFSDYLIGTIDMLAQQPYAGKKHDKLDAVREFRVKPHYLVYYSILESEKIIHILNVIDSRRYLC